MTNRIFFKLLGAFLLVIAVATLTLDFSVRKAWEESLYREIRTSLEQKATLFAQAVQQDRERRSLQAIADDVSRAADARATIITPDGLVLADTRANPAEMENHATRPEFIAALHGSIGSATRTSHTVGIPFLYVAAPIQGGAVRLAYPLSFIQQTTRNIRLHLLWASLAALLLATIISAVVARLVSGRLQRIVVFADRIASGDLSARIEESSGDEIAHVASALDRTARQLEGSFAAVETGRKQLEALLNSMQDAVLAVSHDRRIQWSNGPMNAIARVSIGSPLVGAVRDPDYLAAVEGALEHNEPRTARATALVPGRTFGVTAAPLPGGGAVAVLHDHTNIERVEKTRRDFIANVSHELRTPLTSIQGFAETLLDLESSGSADAATKQDFLEVIRKNAARMARLTEDLLVLARVESGERAFSLRPTSPAALLDDAVETFPAAAKAGGIEIEVENTATQMVQADKDAIHQVFTNLIDNAIKYAGSGARIAVGAQDDENGVEFYVRDYGPGIASEHLPRLFERFYRVDKARSRESGGTGLGLAIAKHIVRAHGGNIRVASQLNHGCTFAFVLQPAAGTSSNVAAVHGH
ncbi:MAG: HAMP domain-containing protein [Acidobacteriia bacterium]|nr:HAMP domain-containing protein [Terriglobia bacterium]